MTNVKSAADWLHSSHMVAIRTEIGDRLRSMHDQTRVELPSDILKLMIRLRDASVTI